MEQEKQFLANKRFSQVISEGFYLFANNYLKIIVPFALFIIASILAKALLLTDINWNLNSNDILNKYYTDPFSLNENDYQRILGYVLWAIVVLPMIDNIIGALFTVIAMCVVSNYLYKKYLRTNTDFNTDFKKGFNSKLILVLLIVGIGVPVGFSILWIPGIIIFGFFIFLVFTYNMEGIERPSQEARSIAKGSFRRIIAIFFICALIEYIVNLIYQTVLSYTWIIDSATINSWYNPISRNYGMIFLYDLVYDIMSILLAPLFICLLTALFASSRAKKELGYQYKRAYYPTREPYRQPYPPPIQTPYQIPEPYKPAPVPEKAGMYCPYCGYYIATPRKFCQNCGESLEFK